MSFPERYRPVVAFRAAPLVALLEQEARRADDHRFAARNFLLDERLPDHREARYSDFASDEVTTRAQWQLAHQEYLDANVFIGPSESNPYPPLVVGPSEPRSAETFRTEDGYVGTELSPDDELVRIEPLDFVRMAFARPDDEVLFDEVTAQLRSGKTLVGDTRNRTDRVLREWPRDLRPCFAAPTAEFEGRLDWSDASWPDRMRDALGLLLDPDEWGGPIDVVLYRYRVAELPQASGGGFALLGPCVLDGQLSNAFCPAPHAAGFAGRAVSFGTESDRPVREIVHAPISLVAAHLASVGTITEPIQVPLAPARRAHLGWLRGLDGADQFADSTDADLITAI